MERCRLCSSPVASNSIMRIFDMEGTLLKLKERILNRLQIFINEYDILPTIICRSCYKALQKCESIVENAQKTQEVLLKLVAGSRANILVSAQSTALRAIVQEPIASEEKSSDDYDAEECALEIREMSTRVEDDQNMFEFVEVKPFVKTEPSEFPDSANIIDGRSIFDEDVIMDHKDDGRTKFDPGDISSCDEHDDNEILVGTLSDVEKNADSVTNGIKLQSDSRKNANSVNNEVKIQSWERYEQEYTKFTKWRTTHNISSISESALLTYFKELSATQVPTTQWSIYSMLKSTVLKNENINIENYTELLALLKSNAKNYTSKMAPLFTPKNINDYCKLAKDDDYLLQKVVMVFFLCGAKRCHELIHLKTKDVRLYRDKMFLVRIPKESTKAKNFPYQFFIKQPQFFAIVKKYRDLRPAKTTTDRFFVRYDKKSKKCINHVVGRNKFGVIPKQIAKFLQLPNHHEYRTSSFTRSAIRQSIAIVQPVQPYDVGEASRHANLSEGTSIFPIEIC